ncbi:hypothetical protein ACQKE0_04330 [Shewanella colwelliana]|uniref:hypothetical protein n=1 Tax=Shewanella colwelliana TaxID=23 RepID=UPI003D041710
MAMRTNQDIPLSVGFDKLSGSIRVDDKEVQKAIVSNLKLIAEGISNLTGYNSHHLLRTKGGYKFSIQLPLLEDIDYSRVKNGVPHLFVQVMPFASNRSFLRFELKGFPLSRSHYFWARCWLEKIIPIEHHDLLASDHILITHVDIAHDIEHDIDHMVFNFKNSQISGVFFNKQGGIGTCYFNQRKAQLQLTVYDRRANCKKKNLSHNGQESTRVEVKIKLNCKLADFAKRILSLEYLNRITIYDRQKCLANLEASPFILRCIALQGLKATLQMQPKPLRRKLQRQLEEYELSILDANQVAEGLKKELCQLKGLMQEFSNRSGVASKPAILRQEFKEKHG